MLRDLFGMWKNTRMVVLTAICAALYAAVLIPFKLFPIVPGFTEIRPANAIPIVVSLLFGPAGAWGTAIGNLIGDFFGTLSLASFFGFVGNLLYGLVPYKLWQVLCSDYPDLKTAKHVVVFVLAALCSSAACGTFIGWGIDWLNFAPFAFLANIIFFNNLIITLILSPILLMVLSPRIKAWGLYYEEVLPPAKPLPPVNRLLGILLVVFGTLGSMYLGNYQTIQSFLNKGQAVMPAKTATAVTPTMMPPAKKSSVSAKKAAAPVSLSPTATTLPEPGPKGSLALDKALFPYILATFCGLILL